jgi:hypothetical protein
MTKPSFPVADEDARARFRITYEQQGFRDVHWCHRMNEPIIVQYKPGTNDKHCDWCNGWDETEHPFLCHIEKGQFGSSGESDAPLR